MNMKNARLIVLHINTVQLLTNWFSAALDSCLLVVQVFWSNLSAYFMAIRAGLNLYVMAIRAGLNLYLLTIRAGLDLYLLKIS